jgi:hypothetical protein
MVSESVWIAKLRPPSWQAALVTSFDFFGLNCAWCSEILIGRFSGSCKRFS